MGTKFDKGLNILMLPVTMISDWYKEKQSLKQSVNELTPDVASTNKKEILDISLKVADYLDSQIYKYESSEIVQDRSRNTAIADFLRVERDPQNIVKIVRELVAEGRGFASYQVSIEDKIDEISYGYAQRRVEREQTRNTNRQELPAVPTR